MKRTSSRKITAIIPYYGYVRAVKIIKLNFRRENELKDFNFGAEVAKMQETMGVDGVIALDLHSSKFKYFINLFFK